MFDSANEPAEPAFSNFGIPYNLTPRIPRAAAALQPVPGETGRVEVMQIEGFTGRDLSAFAVPPNLGIIAVRYPVRDGPAYQALLRQRGIEPAFSGQAVTIAGLAPASRVGLFAVRDPDGNLTEFYYDCCTMTPSPANRSRR